MSITVDFPSGNVYHYKRLRIYKICRNISAKEKNFRSIYGGLKHQIETKEKKHEHIHAWN